ncbi:MAG: DUF1768 domain-containing protein [Flavobacteriales bacterium]|nr:DUF1768 domain-containing protein [Flavobacteriales bacterium]
MRVKLAHHWDKFGELLLRTGDKPIVEDSRKDQFWGAVMNESGQLEGRNALGRLLMELREELKGPERERLRTVKPLDIPEFLLYGQLIGLVEARATKAEEDTTGRRLKPLGTRRPDEPVKTYATPAAKADLFSEPEDPMHEKEPKPKEPLKPYPAYKPAAVPWLQQVPEHWELKRAKSVFRAIDVKSKTGKEELLTVSSANGIVKRRESNVNMFKAKTYVGHKLCWPEDLVINSLWAWGRGLGFSKEHGIISTAYGVYRLREPHKHLWQYLNYTLRSSVYQWELQVRSKGVWKSRLQLTDASFFDMPILMPPKEDAELIVRYLHALDAKVKRYIRTKRTLIARLQEQKQAIIQRAVTRGLDPNVKLKPSGVEWLGEVPEHWDVKRGKAVFEVIDVRSKTGNEELLSVSAVNGVVLRSSSQVHMFMAASYIGHKLCWPEDLVINSLWAWAKGFGFSKHHGIVSTAYSVYRLRPQYKRLWRYLDVLLRSGAYDWDFTVRSRGVWKSRLQLTDSSFLDMRMILPSAKEADEIVEYIRTETKDLDEALSRVNKEIEVLQEYHTRLISDVVTGAVDVREAAKAIEEVVPVEDSMDEAVELEAEVEGELDTNE